MEKETLMKAEQTSVLIHRGTGGQGLTFVVLSCNIPYKSRSRWSNRNTTVFKLNKRH